MTIDEVFNKYKGQSLLVPGADPSDAGQCVQAADYFIHESYGLPYVWLNAIDWWRSPDANLKANFDFITYTPSMPIKQGDFVIYGTGVGSPYGHISTAGQNGVGNNYLGYDSNWAHNLTLHAQPHNDSYNQYILGVLRKKGNNGIMLTQSQLDKLIKMGKQDEPRPDELSNTAWANDPGLAVDAIWGGYGEQVYTHRLTKGDIDNLLKDVGITPTKADYDEVGASYRSVKDFAYYLQKRIKEAPSGGYAQVGTIDGKPIYRKD